MPLNISCLNFNYSYPKNQKASNKAPNASCAGLSFRGYYNDVSKFDPYVSTFFEYSLERARADEKERRGGIIYKPGIIFNRNTTDCFRGDLNWIEFGDYLEDRFKNYPKVNTYDYACANGLEAYTLSLLLQSKLPNDYEKFFPIRARDVNPDEIVLCKEKQATGQIEANNAYAWIKYGLGMEEGDLGKYLFVEEDDIPENDKEYFTKKVMSGVEFSCANVLDSTEDIDTSYPSLFLCRNMWPYVQPSEYQPFCNELYKKLPKGSVVVIGGYEYKGQKGFKDSNKFPRALMKSGFVPADCCYYKGMRPLVFEKN